MANNILSAIIDVKAPNVEATFSKVSSLTDKTTASLSKLQKQVLSFGGGVRPFTASLLTASTALTKTVSSSNQATLALTNLGRVVQDAPFGFIGIANNLNPLLESFQRLKASTGSTGGALKALGKELIGAGGLGLALSVASSLLIVFGDRIFGASKNVKEHKEAIQLTETEYDRFSKNLKEVSDSIAKEATSFAFLTAYSNDATVSLKLRNAAISEINEKYSSYLSNLSQEVSSYKDLNRAINDNIRYLAVQAEIKALLPAINKDFSKAIQLQVELNQLQRARDLGENNLFGISEEDYQKESKLLKGQINAILNSIKVAKKSFEIIAGSSKGVLDSLFPDLGKIKPPDGVTIDDSIPIIKLNKPIPIAATVDLKDIEIISSADLLKEKDFGSNISKALSKLVTAPNIRLSPEVIANNNSLAAMRVAAGNLAKSFNESLSNALGSGLASIGEGLGDVISGKGFGSSIINVIGSLLEELGKALISFGIVKSGLDKLLGPGGIAIPGGVAIALGVAAIAFGRIFKNSVGARAVGGPVSKGNPYVVGERGQEIFIPNTAGRIVPNNKIGMASSGMNNIVITGVFKQKGNDLVAVLSNVNRYQSRNS